MRSKATTVDEYLAELPAERRHAIETVRETMLANLPEGYRESMSWGMISYEVPLDVKPDTYNGQPLMYAALASQKSYMSVYLSAIYSDPASRDRFEKAYRATGKRYDVGKSCVRFRKLEDLALDVIADAVAAVPVDRFIGMYERGRRQARGK